jgi:two-component system cell cycle sensor histidine kinase/response regulator CckA
MKPPSLFHRVLVIDDTPAIHDDFRKILAPTRLAAEPGDREMAQALFGASAPVETAPSFHVDFALQGEEGLSRVLEAARAGRPYTVAFVDMRMPPGWDGIETIRQLWAADPALQIVLCTAYSDHSWTGIISQLGVTDKLIILKKPFDNIEVLQLAHALTDKWALNRKLEQRVRELDALTGRQANDLETAEQRFSAAFFGNPQAFAIIGLPDGLLLDANDGFWRLVGAETGWVLRGGSVLGLPAWSEPEVLRSALEALAAGESVAEFETKVRRAEGGEAQIQINPSIFRNGASRYAFLTVKDVTDRRRLEHQLRQMQKIECIGQLAAGITHDFNNSLTVIKGMVGLALLRPELSAELRDELKLVDEAASGATALTRQLLLFSRQEPMQREPVDPARTLLGTRRILDRLIGNSIQMEWKCEPGGSLILADAANLEQVVINLVINARDALPSGGRIVIAIESVVLRPEDTVRNAEARAGEHVHLSVMDTGTGMSPEVQARVFEPFFTTKEPGKGTGLGLATVYSIVKQHEGWIELKSAVGRGTTFSLYFPHLSVLAPPAELLAAQS